MKIQMSTLAKGKVGRTQHFYTLLANVSHHVCSSGLTRADAASSSVVSAGRGRRAKGNKDRLYERRFH